LGGEAKRKEGWEGGKWCHKDYRKASKNGLIQ
jgi:hypothetical protein